MLLAFAILPQPGFVPPSPPAEKATTRQDEAGKASTRDGARNRRCREHQFSTIALAGTEYELASCETAKNAS
jgi:hypothetical protein